MSHGRTTPMSYKCVSVSENFLLDHLIFHLILTVTIDNVPKKGKGKNSLLIKISRLYLVIYLLIYHPLLFLFLWSYHRTMFKPIATPPSEVNMIVEFSFDCFFDLVLCW